MKPKANLLNLNNCPLECYCQDTYSIFSDIVFSQVTFPGCGVAAGLRANIKLHVLYTLKSNILWAENSMTPIGTPIMTSSPEYYEVLTPEVRDGGCHL